MIIGIGQDICDIRRIEKTLEKFGDRFTHRVFTEVERRTADRRRQRAPTYAKRFAAKEAFSKALGLGLRGPMTLLSLEILNDRRGKPFARARKDLAPYLDERKLIAHVSLSDESDHVMAFVVLEQISAHAALE